MFAKSSGLVGIETSGFLPSTMIPASILAERASISRMTLSKVEKGEPGVSLGIYATVLFTLGMVERLADVADPRHDTVGLELEAEQLPQRIRLSRRQVSTKPEIS
jgi:transcriptional regulator with XRE-family HTH domain